MFHSFSNIVKSVCLFAGLSALNALPARAASQIDQPVAGAAAAGPDVVATTSLRQVVENMGYLVDQSGTTWISFQAGTYRLVIEPSTDGTVAYIEIKYTIPDDKATKLPFAQILEWNGAHASYFGTIKAGDGSFLMILQSYMGMPAVTARTLRSAIDNLTATATNQQALLNPYRWN